MWWWFGWLLVVVTVRVAARKVADATQQIVDVVDLTHPTSVHAVAKFYGAVDRSMKICINCGVPGLGTTMHLEQETSSSQAVYPAVIPTEYLLTRLAIVDVSSLIRTQPALVLSLDVALQWPVLRRDPIVPTLLLFKFGWHTEPDPAPRSCVCKIPGMSFELAEWIAANLTRVVGVATDAPTLESEETRQFNTRTVASILGKSGVYMIENVKIRKQLPERGCMAVAMPLKMLHSNYVPSRLTAFCPSGGQAGGVKGAFYTQVVISLRKEYLSVSGDYPTHAPLDVGLEDII
ncbi:hypothetical protein O0L34_g8552 [Tuta absoluta]|nr:hypothetical protein O0L34_g8552 [Tuta absoluta]